MQLPILIKKSEPIMIAVLWKVAIDPTVQAKNNEWPVNMECPSVIRTQEVSPSGTDESNLVMIQMLISRIKGKNNAGIHW